VGGRRGTRRIGKILRAVFYPDSHKLAGYLVGRPDLLFMFKRRDRFLAYDAFQVVDGRVIATIDHDSWDAPACKRLALDWESCLILEGMDIVTKNRTKLGTIDAVEYDERTGRCASLLVADGIAARALIGHATIPIDLVIGFEGGALVVKRAASEVKSEGGLAAKAGEQTAVAMHAVKTRTQTARNAASNAGKKASKAAGKAIDAGSVAVGKQLGKTKGMFKAFKDEYKKESARDK
jgi:sporulation protein YlmC with PRC-barrel domain